MTEAIRWLFDSVCVIDGWCYGVAPTGRNVCLGQTEDVVRRYAENAQDTNLARLIPLQVSNIKEK